VRHDGQTARRCVNVSCPARIKQSLLHFVSKGGFDVEGIGPKLIDQVVDNGIVARADDLFRVSVGQWANQERMGAKSAQNVFDALEGAKRTTLARFLFALGIPEVGASASRLLADAFESLEKLIGADRDALLDVPDIGPATADAIIDFFGAEVNRQLVEGLLAEGVIPGGIDSEQHAHSDALAGLTFVLTGTLSTMSRGEAAEKIHRRGGAVSSSVSRKTSYVVVGKDPGGKASRAVDLGVSIVDEAAFLEMIGSEGIQPGSGGKADGELIGGDDGAALFA